MGLAAGAGLIADRYFEVPLNGEFLLTALAIAAWILAQWRHSPSAAMWLWLAAGALAASHHHIHRHGFAADDIGNFTHDRLTVVRIRGTLDEEPARFRAPRPDPLMTLQKTETTTTILAVTNIATADGWQAASGRARLTVEGRLDDIHLGDSVEVTGRLYAPSGPANPGEMDYRSLLRDRRITAEIRTKRSADGIARLEEGWRSSLFGWLAAIRGFGTRALQSALPDDASGLAAALLLGDGTALDRDEWDAFVRTGVVHVLAISGQHLFVLAAFLWLVLRVFGTRRRHGAWVVMAVMIGYTLLTGAKPSAVRSAIMVCVFCGGLVLRRPVIPANAFAAAWLAVIAFNPTDPFTAGCQLSFLSVFVLIWGLGRWLAPRPPTPLQALVAATRSVPEQLARRTLRMIAAAFAVSLVLGIANAPLVLAWQNLVSPAGVLLGPPLILLTSIALIAGFLLLLAAPLGSWLAMPFALVVHGSLAICGWLVHQTERIPGGWIYAPGPSNWWLVGFYALLAGVVLLAGQWRKRCLIGLFMWVLFGLLLGIERPPRDELRIAFLAVGHGGCVVIEAPDGRVLLYDAGTATGPDAIRRVVAPYLWNRGIARIDELFLSHADLDHFNGVNELAKRFPIGRVTTTPSFSEKVSPGVDVTMAALIRRGVPHRIAKAGDRFSAGDLTIDVLHPPEIGPSGNENARSLVLLIRHAGCTFLLTGDLEGAGQELALRQAIPPIDVMLAPHHGAVAANARKESGGRFSPGPIAAWAKPRFVVSCQEPRDTRHLQAAYGPAGGTVWDTASVGAVIVRNHASGLVAEAFRSREVLAVKKR
ncbi:MAG TPA: DNA internalization-related competence protein ComEC/Rec2 [Urbifossiella sp.]|nr:DNA internalization-related competence protein ComEC/Rec2 [Urbifossiella sp.]